MTVLQTARRRKNSCTMAGMDWGGYFLFCTARSRIGTGTYIKFKYKFLIIQPHVYLVLLTWVPVPSKDHIPS